MWPSVSQTTEPSIPFGWERPLRVQPLNLTCCKACLSSRYFWLIKTFLLKPCVTKGFACIHWNRKISFRKPHGSIIAMDFRYALIVYSFFLSHFEDQWYDLQIFNNSAINNIFSNKMEDFKRISNRIIRNWMSWMMVKKEGDSGTQSCYRN